jgi:hypothetical protein
LLRHLQFPVITQEGSRPATFAAPGAGSGESGVCGFPDNIPIKFRERPEDMKNQLSAAGGQNPISLDPLKRE